MPSALEPGQGRPVVLDSDIGKSPEPTFFVKSLSIRDFRQVVGLLTSVKTSKQNGKALDAALSGTCRVVVGWENMVDPESKTAMPYSAEALESLLTIEEAIELLGKCILGERLDEDDRKKSESQL